MDITVFTDPGCPFGFNAQRQDIQLLWHYGHAVSIERRMIVLRDVTVAYEELGFSRDAMVRGNERLSELYGMPMGAGAPERAVATIDACRAYVAAELHAPVRADLLLRALRVRAFSGGELLDDVATLHGAALDAGIEPSALDEWLRDDAVEARLQVDMAAARAPLPEALALPHKLSRNGDGYRYSTASSVFEHEGRRIVAPGFQPFAVHEVAVASLAPAIERRPPPASVGEALEWAPSALATAEVAELCGITIDAARAGLVAAGARLAPAAGDGYWSLA